MKKENFIENIVEIMELEDASAINESTRFKEMDEWDSLTALSTISMVDDECGVTITNKDLKSVETLGELYDLVIERTK